MRRLPQFSSISNDDDNFLECKRYLADNNALNSSDKFAKVRPLSNAINDNAF